MREGVLLRDTGLCVCVYVCVCVLSRSIGAGIGDSGHIPSIIYHESVNGRRATLRRGHDHIAVGDG